MGATFWVDGTHFSDIGETLQFANTDYAVSPSYDTKFVAIPGYDGGIMPRQQVLQRDIKLNTTLEKTTEAEVREALDAWNALVGPHTGIHKLTLDQWPDRYYKGKFQGASSITPIREGTYYLLLQFTALATSYSTDVMGWPDVPSAVQTLATVPETFVITNDGSSYAYPQWIYTTVGGESVTIDNQTTEETMQYDILSGASDTINFIAEPYLDDGSEPWVVLYNGSVYNEPTSVGSEIPCLAPGDNTLEMTAAAGGTIGVYWRERNY